MDNLSEDNPVTNATRASAHALPIPNLCYVEKRCYRNVRFSKEKYILTSKSLHKVCCGLLEETKM